MKDTIKTFSSMTMPEHTSQKWRNIWKSLDGTSWSIRLLLDTIDYNAGLTRRIPIASKKPQHLDKKRHMQSCTPNIIYMLLFIDIFLLQNADDKHQNVKNPGLFIKNYMERQNQIYSADK